MTPEEMEHLKQKRAALAIGWAEFQAHPFYATLDPSELLRATTRFPTGWVVSVLRSRENNRDLVVARIWVDDDNGETKISIQPSVDEHAKVPAEWMPDEVQHLNLKQLHEALQIGWRALLAENEYRSLTEERVIREMTRNYRGWVLTVMAPGNWPNRVLARLWIDDATRKVTFLEQSPMETTSEA